MQDLTPTKNAVLRMLFERFLEQIGQVDAVQPTCFLSYARSGDAPVPIVERIATDLKTAGVNVVYDRWSEESHDIFRFAERIGGCDLVLVLGSPAFLARSTKSGHVLAIEMDQIGLKLRDDRRAVITLLLEGGLKSALPPLLQTIAALNFQREAEYFASFFELLRKVHRDAPRRRELSIALRQIEEARIAVHNGSVFKEHDWQELARLLAGREEADLRTLKADLLRPFTGLLQVNPDTFAAKEKKRPPRAAPRGTGRREAPRPDIHAVIEDAVDPDEAIEELRRALAAGLSVNTKEREGERSLLFVAVEKMADEGWRSLEVVDFLLGQPGIQVDEANSYGRTPLHRAANIGSVDLVERLLAAGANPLATTRMGGSTIYEAAFSGGSEADDVVQLFHDRGVCVGDRSKDKFTPLMVAIWRANYYVARFLMTHMEKDVVDAGDDRGETAFYKAVRSGNQALVAELIDRGVDYRMQPRPQTIRPEPLFRAAEEGSYDEVLTWIERKADVNASGVYRRTALHQAAENGRYGIVRLLVENGADVLARNNHGRTPRDLTPPRFTRVINYLRAEEERARAQRRNGGTANGGSGRH